MKISATECVPYSEQTCKDIGDKMGRKFSTGDWGTKGCYVYIDGRYKKDIFYGTGGTEAQIKKDPIDVGSDQKVARPVGIDCKIG